MEPVNFKIPTHDPKWLQDLRKTHWHRYSHASWDELDIESWRYLKPKDVLDGLGIHNTDGHTWTPSLSCNDHQAQVTWGSSESVQHESSLEGLRVLSLQDVKEKDISRILQILNLPCEVGTADRFGDLHTSVFDRAMYLEVLPDTRLEKPITLTSELTPEAGVTLMILRIGEGAEVSILDDLCGGHQSADKASLSGHVRLFCLLEQDSKVTFASAQHIDETAKLYQHHHFFLHQHAVLESVYLPIGAKQSRIEQLVSFLGKGATAKTHGLIFGHQKQLFDFESTQYHHVGHTTSDMFFRNVVTDKAKAIFIGNVYIDKKASGSVANQTNKNLLLSPDAEVVSTPKLEIDTEDVQCGHGATVATLSEDEIYYLQSRGLKRQEAMRMVIGGFLSAILDRIPEGKLRDHLATVLESRVQEVVL